MTDTDHDGRAPGHHVLKESMLSRQNLMRRAVMTALMGLGAAACTSPGDPTGPRFEVSLLVHQPAGLSSTLHVDVGTSEASLRSPDTLFRLTATSLHVTGYGEKQVQVTLISSNHSDTLATVRFSENLRAGYQYGIGAVVSRVRPLGTCVGTVMATPLRNSPGDTLFVAYAGLPQGAIC